MSLSFPTIDRPTSAALLEPVAPHDPAAAEIGEKPVFAATGPARPRALKLAGRIAAGLVGLWLVALVLGAFGFGHVPGIQLPRIGGDGAADSGPKPAEPVQRTTAPAPAATHSATPKARAPAHAQAGPRAARPGAGQGGSTGRTGTGRSHATQTHSGPSTRATPTTAPATPAPATSHSHSQATPPGSSASGPGSRSQATTAPGREHSTATPTPGSGQAEHGKPLKY